MQNATESDWQAILAQTDYAFQPIVNIHTGAVFGYEALLRRVESAGFETIAALFDQAHREAVLPAVHEALFRKAVQKFSALAWADQTKLFFNLDSRLFTCSAFPCEVDVRLPQNLPYPGDTVCLEISERHEICGADRLKEKLARLRKMGGRIAVDDFGTGFSGLPLLYFTRPEYIKIDRFYIQDIEKDPSKRMLAASIVNIAHLMGSLAIAEGVETPMEYYCCKNIGCDLVQGYLVQKPQVETRHLRRRYETIHDLTTNDRRNAGRLDKSLIQSEIAYIDPIAYGTELVSVLDRFKENRSNTFFPVVNRNNEALGILREERLREFAYSEYGRSLLANRSIEKTFDDFMTKIPMVDIHTPLEKTLETFSSIEHIEGILVTNDAKYVGFLSAQALIKLINEKNLATARDQNPLTKLPGNEMIYEYVSKALADNSDSYGLVYFDFDHFKIYNDTYGFRRGDRVILLFAELLKQHTQSPDRFGGHVGGDDFFMGVKGVPLDVLVREVRAMAETFRSNVESFYDAEAIRNGCILGRDREGQECCFPLITVSAALLELPERVHCIYSPEEIGSRMADMKKRAKRSADKLCTASLRHFGGRAAVPVEDGGSRVIPLQACTGG